MAIEQTIHPEKQPVKPVNRRVRKAASKRKVILAPDLHEAVLESIRQAHEGKILSHEEVLRRNDL